MALSKAKVLWLASRAVDEGAIVLRGALAQGADGQFTVGDHNLSRWLSQHAGQELIVILAPVDVDSHTQRRQCGVCGRDYEGAECPHCAQARARLRGR